MFSSDGFFFIPAAQEYQIKKTRERRIDQL